MGLIFVGLGGALGAMMRYLISLLQSQKPGLAILYMVLSVGICLTGVMGGMMIAQKVAESMNFRMEVKAGARTASTLCSY